MSKDCLAFGLLILMKVEQKGLRSGLLALVVDVDEVLDLGAVGQVVRLLNTADHQYPLALKTLEWNLILEFEM